MSATTMVGRRRKIKKNHWLKRHNAVPPKKRNLDQHTNFYIRPHVPVDIIRDLFNFRFSNRKSQNQEKLAKKSLILQYSFA